MLLSAGNDVIASVISYDPAFCKQSKAKESAYALEASVHRLA